MNQMRKITAVLPAEIIDDAVESSGANLTETLRQALREYTHRRASQKLLVLRGKVKFDYDWRDLRGKDDEE